MLRAKPFRCPAPVTVAFTVEIQFSSQLFRSKTIHRLRTVLNIVHRPNSTISVLLVYCLAAGIASGCAAENTRSSPIDSSASQRVDSSCNEPTLIQLSRQRRSDTPADLAIGPGDVLTISVPEVDELQHQEIRVASDGTIGLPLIGTMEVAGMSENDLRAAIAQRLLAYMKFPRVELFVERYQARDVAVIGAVQKPGLYDLRSSSQSIIDMIGLAGGITSDAADRVIFAPLNDGKEVSGAAQPSLPTHEGQPLELQLAFNDGRLSYADAQNQNIHNSEEISSSLHSELRAEARSAVPSDTDIKARMWIVLDLSKPANHACLDLPARPGDVVMVPIAGQVMVQGWVRNPGAFRIAPGMTVLGSVSAAGGAMFSRSAELLRTDADGRHTATAFNLSKLAQGEAPDIPVESGDVIIVEKSVIGAVPYTLMQLFNRFGTGVGVGLPAP
jgi:protein involved in polysaccharide export with SLBB domain